MKVRLLSAAMALLAGLLAVLLIDLALGAAAGALAQERKNCPRDFYWERMSGQCCVQDRETLPPNGRIGYTGNSLCNEGYNGIYEHRPTTDGQGPPGCPGYTSFPFLKECTKSDGAAAGGGGLGDDGVIRDASDAVYGGGGGPSNEDLAATGAIAGTIAAVATGSALVRGRLSGRIRQLTDRLAQLDREYSDAAQALERAHDDREALWQERKMLEAAADAARLQQIRLDEAMARVEAWRDALKTSRWAFGISSALVGLAGLLAAPALIAKVGVTAGLGLEAAAMKEAAIAVKLTALRYIQSVLCAGAASVKSVELEVWKDVKESFGNAKSNTAYLQGKIQADLDRIPREYDEANRRLNEADARVRKIREDQMRIYEELQRAQKGA